MNTDRASDILRKYNLSAAKIKILSLNHNAIVKKKENVRMNKVSLIFIEILLGNFFSLLSWYIEKVAIHLYTE
jgi:hypothetical protein